MLLFFVPFQILKRTGQHSLGKISKEEAAAGCIDFICHIVFYRTFGAGDCGAPGTAVAALAVFSGRLPLEAKIERTMQTNSR